MQFVTSDKNCYHSRQISSAFWTLLWILLSTFILSKEMLFLSIFGICFWKQGEKWLVLKSISQKCVKTTPPLKCRILKRHSNMTLCSLWLLLAASCHYAGSHHLKCSNISELSKPVSQLSPKLQPIYSFIFQYRFPFTVFVMRHFKLYKAIMRFIAANNCPICCDIYFSVCFCYYFR